MSAALPDTVDAWRMVQARRSFQGSLPLEAMQRLRGSLAETGGEVRYALEFGRDDLGVAYLDVRAKAGLPLVCQRSLDVFVQPVEIETRLGLIAEESEEAALPSGYEPLLVDDGQLHLADVIEDELILAVPVVALKPGTDAVEAVDSTPAEDEREEPRRSPFEVLGQLRNNRR